MAAVASASLSSWVSTSMQAVHLLQHACTTCIGMDAMKACDACLHCCQHAASGSTQQRSTPEEPDGNALSYKANGHHALVDVSQWQVGHVHVPCTRRALLDLRRSCPDAAVGDMDFGASSASHLVDICSRLHSSGLQAGCRDSMPTFFRCEHQGCACRIRYEVLM